MNWAGKRVLLTGHTGFKGGWLALWLQQSGAELCGVALEPAEDSLYRDAGVGREMRSVFGDIRGIALLKQTFAEHRPEIVFHLAAQPLVRSSYLDPIGTYSTNVMGTANLLEAVRGCASVRAIVVITTDKCYENREWGMPYRESDRLGGYDPYSNSKACAELVVSAYRDSFFNPSVYRLHGVALATVRAGNVIGGGDWALDRLVPDAIRAFQGGRSVQIRNPLAVRPWQHVLEPLRGYLTIAELLYEDGPAFGEAWNFGPDQHDARPVEWVVNELARLWGEGARWELVSGGHLHEGQVLRLDSTKAADRLGWHSQIRIKDALAMTVAWYQAKLQGLDMRKFTNAQIEEYPPRLPMSLAHLPAHGEVRV
jgi:CDP-glucose 4,6-dehydratase